MRIVVIIILCFVIFFSIKHLLKKIYFGKTCCGNSSPIEQKIEVLDTNTFNYPFCYLITIDGMVCGNCVRHLENAINSHEGVWAKINLRDKIATVYTKKEISSSHFSKIIREAGYTAISIKEIKNEKSIRNPS